MGSSGSGSFSDYSGSSKKEQSGGGASGGASGEDRCRQAFSVGLEDVGQYDLYTSTGGVPAIQTQLTLIFSGRLIAVDPSGTSVGALPTRLNYLAACLRDGFQYVGIVQNSASGTSPTVDVDFVVA